MPGTRRKSKPLRQRPFRHLQAAATPHPAAKHPLPNQQGGTPTKMASCKGASQHRDRAADSDWRQGDRQFTHPLLAPFLPTYTGPFRQPIAGPQSGNKASCSVAGQECRFRLSTIGSPLSSNGSAGGDSSIHRLLLLLGSGIGPATVTAILVRPASSPKENVRPMRGRRPRRTGLSAQAHRPQRVGSG